MTLPRQPGREPFRRTLARTGAIALLAGAALARWQGQPARWPLATLLVLWYSLGGHWVEVCTGLGLGMAVTATWLAGPAPLPVPVWRLWGPTLVGLELVVHLLLQLSGLPNFYNGRG